jgi:hypothetical protein
MLDTFLIPEQTVEAAGESPEIELGAASGKKLLVTLTITRIVEQQSLDVSIWGAGEKALAAFPQKFYAGDHQILLDLTEHPDVKTLRGKWAVARWGRGTLTPRFTFSVRIRELAGEAAA